MVKEKINQVPLKKENIKSKKTEAPKPPEEKKIEPEKVKYSHLIFGKPTPVEIPEKKAGKPELKLEELAKMDKEFRKEIEEETKKEERKKEVALEVIHEIANTENDLYNSTNELRKYSPESPAALKIKEFREQASQWVKTALEQNPDVHKYWLAPRLKEFEIHREKEDYERLLKNIKNGIHFGDLKYNLNMAGRQDYTREARQDEIKEIVEKIREIKEVLSHPEGKSPEEIAKLKTKRYNLSQQFLRFGRKTYCRKSFVKPSLLKEQKESPIVNAERLEREREVFKALKDLEEKSLKLAREQEAKELQIIDKADAGKDLKTLLNLPDQFGKVAFETYWQESGDRRRPGRVYKGIILLEAVHTVKGGKVLNVLEVVGSLAEIIHPEREKNILSDLRQNGPGSEILKTILRREIIGTILERSNK